VAKKDKTVKTSRFKKYTEAIKKKKYLLLVEGDSAMAGISPIIGRDVYGYYSLRGVPKNTYNASILDIINNKEFNEIRQIMGIQFSNYLKDDGKWYEMAIGNTFYFINEHDEFFYEKKWMKVNDLIKYSSIKFEEIPAKDVNKKIYKHHKDIIRRQKKLVNYTYDNILIASDQDLDGYHIRGLLLSFFFKFTNMIQDGKIKMLHTPIAVAKKGKKITNIFMTIDELNNFSSKSHSIHYKKGPGSWKKEELSNIFDQYGLEAFIKTVELDDEQILIDWMDKSDNAIQKRKEYIKQNNFSITSL